MRRLLSIIIFISIGLVSFCQSGAEKLSEYFKNSSIDLPPDQVFLHMDRNLYHPGDTIRFQAYIRDRQTGVFETKSISLYSLLLNPGHKTIDSSRFRIINSLASGWLLVPEATPFGDYSVLAFTSSMMNYDPKYVFSSPVRIDRLRPVPAPADTKAVKNDPPAYQIPLTQPTIDLRFLPEGGTYIYGINQQLAFNAVTSTGRTLDVKGEILNQKGEKVTGFSSGEFGPGMIGFTPLQGDTYFAMLKGEEFSGMKWPLPVPEKSGVAIHLNNSDKGLIDLTVEGKEVKGNTYYLTLIMNNILVLTKEFRIDTLFKFRVSTEELPAGTAYITLFNSDLNPIAERLVFVNDHKKMKIEIGVSATTVNKGEETELTLNSTGSDGKNISGVLSVSVIDSVSGYYNSMPFPDIESVFLFDRDFYNNLPPKVKLRGLAGIGKESLDLLIMTYGWRKFTLKENTEPETKKELVNYDYLKINNPGPVKKGRSDINILSIEGAEIITTFTDKNGEAFLLFDTLNAYVRQVMILPDKNPVKNVNPVRISFPDNKTFTDKAKLVNKDISYSGTDIPFIKSKLPDVDLDGFIFIEAVTIKGNKAPVKVYVDKYARIYTYASTSTMYPRDFISAFNFEDILVRYNPYYLDTRRKKVYLRPKPTLTGYGSPALIVIDNTPLYELTYEQIATMPASQIASVTFLKGSQGFTIYGEEAIGGIVFVTTKAGRRMTEGLYPDDEFRAKDDLMKPVRLFRTEIEYYIPTKEEANAIPEFQYRPTILWQSEVFLDGEVPVKLKYPNNMVKGTVLVTVNGISLTNVPFSGSIKYLIK